METNVTQEFLGNLNITTLVVCYIFSFIGMFYNWITTTRRSMKHNRNTPNKFSLIYWIENNIKHKLISWFGNIITIFLLLRFGEELGITR